MASHKRVHSEENRFLVKCVENHMLLYQSWFNTSVYALEKNRVYVKYVENHLLLYQA